MQFNLMGTLEVKGDGRTLTPTAAKPRQVLAMLAINAGVMVSAEQLIDELWPGGPPKSAKTTVQTYVYHLRKFLSPSKEPSRCNNFLATRPAGYVLEVPQDNVDVFRFQRLMAGGRNALRVGDGSGASDLLREALSLWRGPMLADVAAGPRLQGQVAFFEEQRIAALSLRIEIDLETGRHQEVIGELRWLSQTHHLNEWVHVRLMQALHRSGRRGEALDAYQKLRRLLGDELGLEPSFDAQQLQQQILAT
ncbi:MAG: AfsR/SARP family transcriptional regulator [Acidobacteria bacterium]|nr:AfsR/SARP family transcriptional regulator [Acidobacteriota bacterium]